MKNRHDGYSLLVCAARTYGASNALLSVFALYASLRLALGRYLLKLGNRLAPVPVAEPAPVPAPVPPARLARFTELPIVTAEQLTEALDCLYDDSAPVIVAELLEDVEALQAAYEASDDSVPVYPCSVCGGEVGADYPSGVCSIGCLLSSQGTTREELQQMPTPDSCEVAAPARVHQCTDCGTLSTLALTDRAFATGEPAPVGGICSPCLAVRRGEQRPGPAEGTLYVKVSARRYRPATSQDDAEQPMYIKRGKRYHPAD